MKNFTLLILLFSYFQSIAQNIDNSYFSTKILIEEDNLGVFEKASFVDSIVADKRIILLGELDHGDGTSFEIKTEIIKHLHEKHGFNNLIFESGFIDCNEMWKSVEKGESVIETTKEHIYYIWSQVKEMQSLFEYVENEYKNGTPLKISGIDPQFSGPNQERIFIDLLKNELAVGELETRKFNELSHELNVMSEWLNYPNKNEHNISEATFHSHLNYFRDIILKTANLEDREIWEMYFENIGTLGSIKWEKRKGSFELRDKQMFNNLKHHLKRSVDGKFIVWAANAHIIRNDKQLKGKDKDYSLIGLKKLGDHIFNEFSAETYSIAILARTGKTLNYLNKEKTVKIGKNKRSSLERKLKGLGIAFVDLKLAENSLNLNEYESQLFYPNVKCTSKWSHHFDGVIFIEKMKPSTPNW